MKNLLTTTLVVFLLAVALIGCNSRNNQSTLASESFAVTDALGREVTFERPPERIVIGGSGSMMITDAAFAFPEANDRIVAYARTDQGKGSFTAILDKAPLADVIENQATTEAMAAYQPDLVLLKSYMKDMGNALEAVNISVVYVDFETLEQYQRDLTNLGIIFNNPGRAQELFYYYESTITSVQTLTKELPQSEFPSVLFIYYSSKDGDIAFNVPPLNWAQTQMIVTAGGNPVWNDIQLDAKWTRVNFEQVAAWDPDIIFLTAYFDDVNKVAQSLRSDNEWSQLSAVQGSQLYTFPSDFYSWDQPHTRWGLAQQWLASKIHPELLPDFDLLLETKDTYQFLYGISEQEFDELIKPVLNLGT